MYSSPSAALFTYCSSADSSEKWFAIKEEEEGEGAKVTAEEGEEEKKGGCLFYYSLFFLWGRFERKNVRKRKF